MSNTPNYKIFHLHELEYALNNLEPGADPEEKKLLQELIAKGGYTYPKGVLIQADIRKGYIGEDKVNYKNFFKPLPKVQRFLRSFVVGKVIPEGTFIKALTLGLVLQLLIPVTWAVVLAMVNGELLCTASIHGDRSMPCGFIELIEDWFVMMIFGNAISFGGITVISTGLAALLISFWRSQKKQNQPQTRSEK